MIAGEEDRLHAGTGVARSMAPGALLPDYKDDRDNTVGVEPLELASPIERDLRVGELVGGIVEHHAVDAHHVGHSAPPFTTDSAKPAPAVKSEPRMVAALFVDPKGVYANLEGVDMWDEERDARLYDGPYPVVAHPPCARWSRLAGFTEARFGYKRGEDGGCFEAALAAVHKFGGVIEHPAYSQAWDRYELPKPKAREGWNISLEGGASCYVEQGRYGLPVKKATWLYAYGVALPKMEWGYTPDGEGLEPNTEWGGLENWRDRWQAGKKGEHPNAIGSAWMRGNRHNGMRSSTPPPFRDALIYMARSVYDMREVTA